MLMRCLHGVERDLFNGDELAGFNINALVDLAASTAANAVADLLQGE